MNNDSTIARWLIIATIVLIGLGSGLLLIRIPQIFEKQASEPACTLPLAFCKWDSRGEGVLYQYTVTDLTVNAVIRKGLTNTLRVDFSAIKGHQYRCQVAPTNECGTGTSRKVETKCANSSSSLALPTSVPTESAPLPSVTLTVSTTPVSTQSSPLITDVPTSVASFSAEPISATPSAISPSSSRSPIRYILIGGITAGVLIVLGLLLRSRTSKISSESATPVTEPENQAPSGIKESIPSSEPGANSRVEGIYDVRLYSLESQEQSSWLTLTKDGKQVMGYINRTDVPDGYATIRGFWSTADSVPYILIESLESSPAPQ